MQVKTRLSAVGAITAAAAMTIAGAGTAAAAPAVNAVPTADYQMCGIVYDSAAWVSNAAPPSGAQGISGVKVKGTLYDSSNGYVDEYEAITDTAGRYCLQGASNLVPVVTSGGYVKLETPNDGATPANQWETTGIYESNFLAHIYVSFFPLITQSANKFHIVR